MTFGIGRVHPQGLVRLTLMQGKADSGTLGTGPLPDVPRVGVSAINGGAAKTAPIIMQLSKVDQQAIQESSYEGHEVGRKERDLLTVTNKEIKTGEIC